MPSQTTPSSSSMGLESVSLAGAECARLDKQIKEIESEISLWRYRNSQSNPGAMIELRELRKELEALKKARTQVINNAK